MNKFLFLLITTIVVIATLVFFLSYENRNKSLQSDTVEKNNINASDNANQSSNSAVSPGASSVEQSPANAFQPPLDRAGERVTKKKFGQYITPQNSPVQPEKFSGYHTGTDFEIFPEELDADVPVKAVCDGKLLSARTASGYGGLTIQSCELDNEPITVLYGHLNIASVKFKAGDEIKAGDVLRSLGADKSTQTDGERKHLHLGFHKGSAIDIRGYVNLKSELGNRIDPCSIDPVCK